MAAWMNQLLRNLWLSFWHLLPANPILVRVVYGASRRQRHLWLRFAYLLTLVGVVLLKLIFPLTGGESSLSELAKSASQTFKWASTVQLGLMCFLAPAFAASAITQERDAQTFNILLSTPLSSAQIVFGSLMSRLYFVLVLLLAGLPIFLMTMVYGGVTTSQIVKSFALAATTAVLTGALAIFIAMSSVGTRRTIFSFYLVIGLYLFGVYLLGLWPRTWIDAAAANVSGRKMSYLTALHPFLSLEVALNLVDAPPEGRLMTHGAIVRYALAYPWAAYLVWTSALALLLTSASIVFVRRGVKTGEMTFWRSVASRFTRETTGDRTRAPRTVWANPVAWREARTKAAGGGLTRWTIILGGFVACVALFVYYLNGTLQTSEVPRWLSAVVIIQFGIVLIIATNTAATSLTREKETKTLDILLTTPLTSRYILWGKLRGLVSFAAPMLLGPFVVLLLFGTYGAIREESPPAVWFESVLLLGGLLVVYTALACVLGLRVSLTSRSNATAVMASLGLLIILCGILSAAGTALISASRGEFAAFVAPFTPFTSIGSLIDASSLFDKRKDFLEGASAARVAAATGSCVALLLYSVIAWRAYVFLVRDFDMAMRKQSGS